MVLDKADVVVVGAGTVGVSAAFFLAEKGLDVALVEREQVAWGASGRNAGFMWIQTRTGGINLDLARAGFDICRELEGELGKTFELRQAGGVIFFTNDAQRRVFEEFAEARRADDVHVEVLDEARARELCPMLPVGAIGATYCPDDGQIRSPEFVRQLAQASRRRGVRIHERTPVLGLLRDASGRVAGVRTGEGEVRADNVVWATGAWASQLALDEVSIPVRPRRLGVLVTAPIPDRMNVAMLGPLTAKQYDVVRAAPSFDERDFTADFEDLDRGYEYLELAIQREDGCLQVGNPEDEDAGFDQRTPLIGLKMMVDALLLRWPHLRGVSVLDQWSGLIPVTADALPIVDAVPGVPGLFVGTGHIFGNTAGPITGKLLSELVAGDEPSLPLEGLAFERPALQTMESAGAVRW